MSLRTIGGGHPPTFTVPLDSATCQEHGHIVFRCQLTAQPRPKIIWQHNGRVIKNNKDVRTTFDGRWARLEIFDVYSEDAGEYICIAENNAGSESTTCSLTVTETEDEVFVVDDHRKQRISESADSQSVDFSQTNYESMIDHAEEKLNRKLVEANKPFEAGYQIQNVNNRLTTSEENDRNDSQTIHDYMQPSCPQNAAMLQNTNMESPQIRVLNDHSACIENEVTFNIPIKQLSEGRQNNNVMHVTSSELMVSSVNPSKNEVSISDEYVVPEGEKMSHDGGQSRYLAHDADVYRDESGSIIDSCHGVVENGKTNESQPMFDNSMIKTSAVQRNMHSQQSSVKANTAETEKFSDWDLKRQNTSGVSRDGGAKTAPCQGSDNIIQRTTKRVTSTVSVGYLTKSPQYYGVDYKLQSNGSGDENRQHSVDGSTYSEDYSRSEGFQVEELGKLKAHARRKIAAKLSGRGGYSAEWSSHPDKEEGGWRTPNRQSLRDASLSPRNTVSRSSSSCSSISDRWNNQSNAIVRRGSLSSATIKGVTSQIDPDIPSNSHAIVDTKPNRWNESISNNSEQPPFKRDTQTALDFVHTPTQPSDTYRSSAVGELSPRLDIHKDIGEDTSDTTSGVSSSDESKADVNRHSWINESSPGYKSPDRKSRMDFVTSAALRSPPNRKCSHDNKSVDRKSPDYSNLNKSWRSTSNLYGRKYSADIPYSSFNSTGAGYVKRNVSRESSIDSEKSVARSSISSQESFANKMSRFESQNEPLDKTKSRTGSLSSWKSSETITPRSFSNIRSKFTMDTDSSTQSNVGFTSKKPSVTGGLVSVHNRPINHDEYKRFNQPRRDKVPTSFSSIKARFSQNESDSNIPAKSTPTPSQARIDSFSNRPQSLSSWKSVEQMSVPNRTFDTFESQSSNRESVFTNNKSTKNGDVQRSYQTLPRNFGERSSSASSSGHSQPVSTVSRQYSGYAAHVEASIEQTNDPHHQKFEENVSRLEQSLSRRGDFATGRPKGVFVDLLPSASQPKVSGVDNLFQKLDDHTDTAPVPATQHVTSTGRFLPPEARQIQVELLPADDNSSQQEPDAYEAYSDQAISRDTNKQTASSSISQLYQKHHIPENTEVDSARPIPAAPARSYSMETKVQPSKPEPVKTQRSEIQIFTTPRQAPNNDNLNSQFSVHPTLISSDKNVYSLNEPVTVYIAADTLKESLQNDSKSAFSPTNTDKSEPSTPAPSEDILPPTEKKKIVIPKVLSYPRERKPSAPPSIGQRAKPVVILRAHSEVTDRSHLPPPMEEPPPLPSSIPPGSDFSKPSMDFAVSRATNAYSKHGGASNNAGNDDFNRQSRFNFKVNNTVKNTAKSSDYNDTLTVEVSDTSKTDHSMLENKAGLLQTVLNNEDLGPPPIPSCPPPEETPPKERPKTFGNATRQENPSTQQENNESAKPITIFSKGALHVNENDPLKEKKYTRINSKDSSKTQMPLIISASKMEAPVDLKQQYKEGLRSKALKSVSPVNMDNFSTRIDEKPYESNRTRDKVQLKKDIEYESKSTEPIKERSYGLDVRPVNTQYNNNENNIEKQRNGNGITAKSTSLTKQKDIANAQSYPMQADDTKTEEEIETKPQTTAQRLRGRLKNLTFMSVDNEDDDLFSPTHRTLTAPSTAPIISTQDYPKVTSFRKTNSNDENLTTSETNEAPKSHVDLQCDVAKNDLTTTDGQFLEEEKDNESELMSDNNDAFIRDCDEEVEVQNENEPNEEHDVESQNVSEEEIEPETKDKILAQVSHISESEWDNMSQARKATKPSFIIKPRRCFVDQGKTAKFKASLDGEPPPTLRWERNGNEIEDGGRYHLYEKDDFHYLEIDDVCVEDKGPYTCIITNKNGQDQITADLDLFVPRVNRLSKAAATPVTAKDVKSKFESLTKEKNTLHRPSETKTSIDIGRSPKSSSQHDVKAKFERLADKGKDSNVNSPVKASHTIKTSSPSVKTSAVRKNSGGDTSNSSVHSNRAEVKSSGYDAKRKEVHSSGYGIKKPELKKQTALQSPSIDRNKKDISEDVDSSIKETKSLVDEQTIVQDKVVASNEREEIPAVGIEAKQDLLSSSSSISSSSTGGPRVRARTRAEARQVKKTPPQIEHELEDVTVEDGEEAVLACSVTGDPQPTIRWLTGGELLPPGDDIQQLYDGRTAQLVFKEVFPDDTGEYQVVATNSEGEAKSQCVLTVKVPESPAVSPEFTSQLTDQTVEDGANLILECSLSALPPPVVTWLKNGQPIPESSPDFKPSFDGDTARLEIVEVFPEDSGTFECVAVNEAGEASTQAMLTVLVPESEHIADDTELVDTAVAPVEEPEEPPPPIPVSPPPQSPASTTAVKGPCFVRKLQDKTVVDGDRVMLEVEVDGYKPIEICWLHGKEEIKADSKIYQLSREGNYHRLLIPEVFPEDGGLYVCEAYNEFGDTDTACMLTVQDKFPGVSTNGVAKAQELPQEMEDPIVTSDMFAPEFLVRPKPANIEEGQTVTFSCEIEANPPPQVSWEKDGKLVEEDDRILITQDGLVCSLTIEQACSTDKGRYFCVASNVIGTEKCGVSLVVQAAATLEIADFRSMLKNKPKGPETKKFTTAHQFPQPAKKDAEQVDFRNVLGRHVKPKVGAAGATESPSQRQQEVVDYRRALERHVKTNEGRDVDKSGTQQDFRQVLQRNVKTKASPTVDHNKPTADQLDFRNVLARKVQTRERPKFLEELHDVTVKEGKSGTLSCKVTGIPPPKIIWYHDKKEIKESQFFHMSYENDVATLKIAEVYGEDGGEYICAAVNEAGNVQTSADIIVKESYLLHHPEPPPKPQSAAATLQQPDEPPFIEDLQPENVQVLRGRSFTLTGKFVGWPMPEVMWHRGRRELKQDGHIQISTKRDLSILTVKSSKVEDTGKYTLTITNELGTDSFSASVTVEDRPEPPVGQPGASNITNVSMTVSWMGPSYDGGCQVTHYQVEMSTPGHNTWTVLSPNCKHTSYTVTGLEPNKEYIFRVCAANKHGFSEPGKVSEVFVTTDRHFSTSHENTPVSSPAQVKVPPKTLSKPARKSSADLSVQTHSVRREDSTSQQEGKDTTEQDFLMTPTDITPSPDKLGIDLSRQLSLKLSGPLSPEALRAARDQLPFEPRDVIIEPSRKFAQEYSLGEEIGKGRFGQVCKCTENATGNTFAAKFIKVKPSQRKEMKIEMAIMNELHHPKLLLLYDAFECPREMILVMEHIAGGELFERIIDDDYILTERECIHFMRQICDGIKYMHSKFILHLDLKPENILCISKNSNEIKIIDFGLARKFDPTQNTRVLFGTPEFVAPEVINYEEIGFPTDVWSIGVICYILLSGLSPFLGDSEAETLANVTAATWDFEDETFDEISDNAKDFISSMLTKQMRHRLSIDQLLEHKWLSQDVKYMRAKRLSTKKHKKFMARRKWQSDQVDGTSDISNSEAKTGNAIRALGRMASLQKSLSNFGQSNGSDANSRRQRSRASSLTSPTTEKTRPFVRDASSDSGMPSATISDQDHNANDKKFVVSQDSGIAEETEQEVKETNVKTSHSQDIENGEALSEESSTDVEFKFTQKMIDTDVYHKDSARFDVRFSGSGDDFKVKWFKNDMELLESKKFEFQNAKNRCSLIIRNCVASDEGQYECKVTSASRAISCDADLYVAGTGRN